MAEVIISGLDRDKTIQNAVAVSTPAPTQDDATSSGNYTGTNRSYYEIEISEINAIGNAVADGSNTGMATATSGGTYTGSGISSFDIEIDGEGIVGSANPDGGNSGANDATSGGTYTGTSEATYTVQIQQEDEVGVPSFNGSGNNDMSTSGTYSGTGSADYEVEIDELTRGDLSFVGSGEDDLTVTGAYNGTGSHTWTIQIGAIYDGGFTSVTNSSGMALLHFSTPHNIPLGSNAMVLVTGSDYYDGLAAGASVTSTTAINLNRSYVDDDTGHVEQVNKWRYKIDAGSYSSLEFIEYATSGSNPTTATMYLQDGIYIKFDDFVWHIENDYWTFDVREEDTFKWKKDSGSYTTGVAITGGTQFLSDGVYVQFSGDTGHTLGDKWTFTANPDFIQWNKDDGIWTQNVPITTSAQSLSDGVTVTFGGSNNHDADDFWTITTAGDTFKWQKNAGGYTGHEDITITESAQSLSDGVEITFSDKYATDLGDKWTITTGADIFKWKENNGDYTTGVAIPAAATPISLSKGVEVTFGAVTGHDVGDTWEIRVEGDFTIDRSLTNPELEQYVVRTDYNLTKTLIRLCKYNLQTGVVTLIADTEGDNSEEVEIVESSESYAGTPTGLTELKSDEQIDLEADLNDQDPGSYPDNPVGGY